jgi:hypothetical protein
MWPSCGLKLASPVLCHETYVVTNMLQKQASLILTPDVDPKDGGRILL